MDDSQADRIEERLYDGRYRADLSRRYHQVMAWRYRLLDRTIRASVVLLAGASFTASLLTFQGAPVSVSPTTAAVLAFASMAAALVLNVVPVADYTRDYDDLYRSWNAYFGRWLDIELRFDLDDTPSLDAYLREIRDLEALQTHTQNSEPAPWRFLLERCQKQVNLAITEH
ncbi:MAG: hypothetical protein GKR94_28595 [Gammaproteobacteria bacterium]|nr:hypothetical protein [Gammaproteobacteria bacterium]